MSLNNHRFAALTTFVISPILGGVFDSLRSATVHTRHSNGRHTVTFWIFRLLLSLSPAPLPSRTLGVVILSTALSTLEALVVVRDLFPRPLFEHERFVVFNYGDHQFPSSGARAYRHAP